MLATEWKLPRRMKTVAGLELADDVLQQLLRLLAVTSVGGGS